MKQSACILGLALALTAGIARAGDKYLLVETTDHAKTATFAIMTPDEFKALQATIRAETRVHAEALAQARAAWEQDPEAGRFPANAISPRAANVQGMPYDDAEKAEAKLARQFERQAEKRAEADEQARKKLADRFPSDRFAAERRKERMDEWKSRAAAEAAGDDKARALYAKALAALTGAPVAPDGKE